MFIEQTEPKLFFAEILLDDMYLYCIKSLEEPIAEYRMSKCVYAKA